MIGFASKEEGSVPCGRSFWCSCFDRRSSDILPAGRRDDPNACATIEIPSKKLRERPKGDRMAETPSQMVELGRKAPEFSLTDTVSGQTISLKTFSESKALLVMFICPHCPFVKHVQNQLALLGRDYADRNIGIVAISSNDAESFPDDAPPRLKEMAEKLNFLFPFCYDESQEVAKAYGAACTPDFFLFDQFRVLVYRGQLDGSRPGNGVAVTGLDLRLAIDAVLSDLPIDTNQRPSIGCNIKWKPGNEPAG
jgi:peroxiredoxin